jgi:DNA repair protein RAD16
VFRGVEEVESLDGYLELNAAQKAEVADRVRASADEDDEDNVPVEPDELVRKSWNQPMEPSPDLLMPLLAYQKEGLGWMVHQEQNDAHGGTLSFKSKLP